MNRSLLGVFLTICLLSSCASVETKMFSEFVAPDPETTVRLMPLVREYFFTRKQAVLSGQMEGFYARYPSLQVGINIDQGINIEALQVDHMRNLAPFDGNIFPEYYEKIKIKEKDNEIQVLIHGIALYLWKDVEGIYKETGGEFKMVIYFTEQEGDWQVYKTDEVTLSEWQFID